MSRGISKAHLNHQRDREKSIAQIATTAPRTDAVVTLADGRTFSAPIGTPLEHYIWAAFPDSTPSGDVMAAIVDNRLAELTLPITRDVNVTPLTLADSDAGRIYRRSLVFMMTTAIETLFPQLKVKIQHAVSSGGFFCEVMGRSNFTAAELRRVKAYMKELIEADEPFIRQTIPLNEAVILFREQGDDDKVRLLENRQKPYLTIYRMRNNADYLYGYMVPSTGYLKLFDLQSTREGFVLVFPHTDMPTRLAPYRESVKLERVFRQTDQWLDLMDIEDVGRLNQAILDGRFRDEVLIAEALHSRRIAEIANEVAMHHSNGARVVLIAGPSSSGKTTTSKRLAVQLMAYGIQPFTLEMDNFFVDRTATPKDEHGEYDFESLHALDVERFNRDLLGLMNGAEVQLPHYDFLLGKSQPGQVIRLTNDHIIIIEGIHGLNPQLVTQIPAERLFRIYVSALTALNLDRHNRIPTTDVRLIRRITRDAASRGYSAEDTLNRWESVRRGEKRNIFPYQENANALFNSSLAYELAVLRPLVEPLLRQVDADSKRYIEAKRLLSFLGWVRPTTAEAVPNDSVLREFLGGSILETYVPGKR